MLKVVVDTNILVSAVINKGNPYFILDLAKQGKVQLITSLAILQEFIEVISRHKFHFTQKQIESATKQIITISTIIEPNIKINHIKQDPDDNKILECDISGKADYIVSGDTDLLMLRKFLHVPVITARDALILLQTKES